MGLKSSPYQAVQAVLVAKEYIMGDRRDPGNAFRWDVVRMNLPGSPDYDPSKPWVSKIRLSDGRIAADLFLYVDDGRVVAGTREENKRATRQAASVLNYLGIQEAARKRRWPSRRPGAWAGSVVETTEEEVVVLVSEEKWSKAKMHIGKMVQEVVEGKGYVNFKDMEKRRGFLVYVTRTYPSMVPYLKGIHLTLDSWRPQRDADGWKDPSIRVKASEWEQYDAKSPPKMVKAVQEPR